MDFKSTPVSLVTIFSPSNGIKNKKMQFFARYAVDQSKLQLIKVKISSEMFWSHFV